VVERVPTHYGELLRPDQPALHVSTPCPRCGREMRVAFAYVADGDQLRQLEAFKRCPDGCPGEYSRSSADPPPVA
jgi:hypothetical protein